MPTVNFLLLAGCLAALLALLVASLPTAKPGATFEGYQICERNDQTKEKECATYSLASFVFNKIFKTLNDYNALITATATIFIAWFTLSLRRSTDRLWDAGERQLGHLQESSEKQLRAYISVKEFSVTPMINDMDDVNAWELSVIFQNTGATPTIDLLSHVNVRFETTNIPDDFRFPDTWVHGRKQIYVPTYLAPGAVKSDGAFAFSVRQMIQVQRQEMFLHIYGWADYNDVFPDTPRRRTEFCARVLCPGSPHIRNERNIAFEIHWKHNGADSECMRVPTTKVVRERILPKDSKQNN